MNVTKLTTAGQPQVPPPASFSLAIMHCCHAFSAEKHIYIYLFIYLPGRMLINQHFTDAKICKIIMNLQQQLFC